MKKSLINLGSSLLLFLFALPSSAQVVSNNGFFKGNYVEAGIQPSGAFGSLVSAPSDYISATASKYSGRVGFIADVGKDGFTVGTPKFIGDFFVPGTPYEAFSVKMNGTLYENAGSATQVIPGNVTGYISDGTTSTINWLGNINNLQITQETSVGKTSSYILIKVKLKNTGSATINNIYYTRSVDPDNEVDQVGSAAYTTLNKIEEQNPNSISTALVSGTGLTHGSYLGLGSRDCRARVAIMKSFSSDGESIHNGTGEVRLKNKNETVTADNAIAVAFKIGNLAPGDSTTVAMAYVLNAADLPPAMDETDPLFNVKADTYGSGSVINVCNGSAATLNIINGDGYTWSWAPATGLNQTTGRSVQASLTSDITYVATGINTCGTTRAITLNLHPEVTPNPDAAGTITGPTTVYKGWNATFTVPPIAHTTNYKWTIPAGASFVSGFGTNSVVVKFGTTAVSGAVSVYGENSCANGASSTFNVTVNTASSFSITSANSGIPGGAAFSTPSVVDNQITIAGTDPITNTRVYIDGGFQSGDELLFDGTLPSGVTASYSASTGALSFTGTATPAQWRDIFREVKFKSTSGNTVDRTIKFILGDLVSFTVAGKSHYYEYILPPTNLSWADAYAAAAGRTFFGLAGYLATITSMAENDLIKQKLSSDGWIGGSDDYRSINLARGTAYTTQSQTEGTWYWVNGPEAGALISTGNTTPTVASGGFMNWNPGEPNNAGNENFIQLYSTLDGKWNDLSGVATGSVPGYVVEYGGYPSDPVVTVEYSRTLKSKPAAPAITAITTDSGPSATDFITSDKTLIISGTAIANSTVKVTRTGTGVIGTVTANASGVWSYDYTATTLADGVYTFTATATVSSVESNPSVVITVKIDATAPAKPGKPSLENSVEDFTSEEQPPLKGTAEAGATINLYSGTDLIGTTVADNSGNWIITPISVLAEKQHAITVKATDTAGNISVASDIFSLTVDRTAPVTPSAPAMTDGDGSHTNNTKPTITGNTENNAFVHIYRNGDSITTVKADASGYWEYTFADDLVDGEHTITTKSSDAVGNTSTASSELVITVDTEKPSAPSAPELTGGNNGIINSGTPTVTGTAEPGSVITIKVDGTDVGTATVDVDGNWTYTLSPALVDGDYEITATAKDVSGNTSDVSGSTAITVDTQKPVKPGAPVLTTDNNEGIVKTNTPSISGSSEPNATIYIYDGSALITTIAADESGNWSYTFTPALTDGEHSITTKAEDAAGNISDASSSLIIEVDTQDPVAPSTPVLSGGNDGNINTSTPSVSGTAEPNSTVTIYKNEIAIATVPAGSDGKWSYTFSPALADGEYSITTTATDAAGNKSLESNELKINVDTHSPDKPAKPELTGGNNGNIGTATPTITGTAEPKSTVTVYANGIAVGTVTADDDGNWSYTFSPALDDDQYNIGITSTDASGNTSEISEFLSITVDTQKPLTPSEPAIESDNNDGNSKTNKPVIDGNAEPGSIIKIYDGSTLVGTAVADGTGKWSYEFNPALTDGDHIISVTAEDAAGNISDVSTSIKISIDTQNPAKPNKAELSGGNDGNTNINTPSIGGNAEPGSTITIYNNGVPVATVTTDVHGNWNYTFSPALADGEYNVTTTATDAAGNISEVSAPLIIKVDTEKPATPAQTKLDNEKNGTANTSTPTLSGNAEPGSTVTIYKNGVPVGTAIAGTDGKWSYTFTPALDDDTYIITTKTTDPAGNTSNTSEPITFRVDTEKPTTPSMPEVTNDNNGGNLKTNKPTIKGNSEPGSTITVYDNGVAVGTVVADEDGNWSYTFDPELTEGEHNIYTTVTDIAGNVSSHSASHWVSVDTGVPSVEVTSNNYKAVGPYKVTIKFSEPVTGFDIDDVLVVNGKASEFVMISPTEYTVMITPANDKGNTSVRIAAGAAIDASGNGNTPSNTMSLKTEFMGIVESVYPNPATNVLNMKFKGLAPVKGKVMLVKMSGQVVHEQEATISNSTLTIDVSRFSAGHYVLVVKANNFVHRVNVMIAR